MISQLGKSIINNSKLNTLTMINRNLREEGQAAEEESEYGQVQGEAVRARQRSVVLL